MAEFFTGKTVEEAKAKAAAKFGKDMKYVKIEVVQEAKKGFLGIGSQDAKIKAELNMPAAVRKEVIPEAAKEAAVRKKAAEEVTAVNQDETVKKETVTEISAESQQTATDESSKAEENKYSETAEVNQEIKEPDFAADETEKKAENVNEETSSENEESEEDYSIENFTLLEDESLINPKVKLAVDYIKSIFNAMDVDFKFEIYQNEKGAIVNIESNNNGTIIGRRGETLDALQYLCSIIANKGDKDYFRITIDCHEYRQKRKETLEQLAAKIAKSVLKTGRSQPLEPMNPYERRVIHSAIAKIDGVSSRSVGEEPYRKIIISSNTPRSNNRRRDNRHDNNKGDRRNGRPRNNKENFERKSVDVSTSFEKDYKRPKPEDAIEGGLYGKIEL